MGWDIREWRVILRLDSHGGERQKLDDKLADELLEEIRKVVEQEKYQPIEPIFP